MRDFIGSIRIAVGAAAIAVSIGCGASPPPVGNTQSAPPVVIADRFAYPIGDGKKLTPAKDARDAWFNALEFGEENHWAKTGTRTLAEILIAASQYMLRLTELSHTQPTPDRDGARF